VGVAANSIPATDPVTGVPIRIGIPDEEYPGIGASVTVRWPTLNVGSPIGRDLSIAGDVSIDITVRPGIDPFTQRGSDGMILIEPERVHIRDAQARWALTLKKLQRLRGRYNSARCAQVAAKAADAISTIGQTEEALLGAEFDWRRYGSMGHSAAQRVIDSWNEAKAARDQQVAILNGLAEDWRNNQCAKLMQH
jgi:hypothetical protein